MIRLIGNPMDEVSLEDTIKEVVNSGDSLKVYRVRIENQSPHYFLSYDAANHWLVHQDRPNSFVTVSAVKIKKSWV